MSHHVAIVIPALNEAASIVDTIKRIQTVAAHEQWNLELVVVNDGSSDATGDLARAAGAVVVQHPTNGGYGLSLQHGIAATTAPFIGITDADGTYPVEELPALLALVAHKGFDMAVGARSGTEYRKGIFKYPARMLFRLFAEYVAGRRIPDINSGLRIMRRSCLVPHIHRTCFGFSFTTSITLIFFLNGFFISYLPIHYQRRVGTSKVNHFHDTLRTAQILTSVICAYNPLKLFILLALPLAILSILSFCVAIFGGGVIAFFLAAGFFVGAIIVFGIGCLAEAVRTNLRAEP